MVLIIYVYLRRIIKMEVAIAGNYLMMIWLIFQVIQQKMHCCNGWHTGYHLK